MIQTRVAKTSGSRGLPKPSRVTGHLPKTRPCPKSPCFRILEIVENSLAQKCVGPHLKKKRLWAVAWSHAYEIDSLLTLRPKRKLMDVIGVVLRRSVETEAFVFWVEIAITVSEEYFSALVDSGTTAGSTNKHTSFGASLLPLAFPNTRLLRAKRGLRGSLENPLTSGRPVSRTSI